MIDWKIKEDASVADAVARMAAYNIGALAVSKDETEDSPVIGVISERDYLKKVGALGRDPKEIKVNEIATYGADNLVSVTLDNPIEKCMEKMLARDIRHLLVRQKETGKIVGMISIKDIVKCAVNRHKAVVSRLETIAVLRNDVSVF
jgi:CBS domain-containing protein